MPTKRFTNLQQMGPIAAEVDANGDALLSGAPAAGSAAVYTAFAQGRYDLEGFIAITAIGFGFSAEDLAAAQRARISARFGDAVFGYFNPGGAFTDAYHPLPKGTCVIIDGNANIQALAFDLETGATACTVGITLEA